MVKQEESGMVKDLLSNYLEDVLRNGVAKPLCDFDTVGGKLYYSSEKDSVCLIHHRHTHMYVLPEGATLTCRLYGKEYGMFTLKRKISEESGKPIWYIGPTGGKDKIFWRNDEMDSLPVDVSPYADVDHLADMFDLNPDCAFPNLSRYQLFANTMPYAQHPEFSLLDDILDHLDEKMRNVTQIDIMHVLRNIPKIDDWILETIREFDNQYRTLQENNYSYEDRVELIARFINLLEHQVVCSRLEDPYLPSIILKTPEIIMDIGPVIE